MSKELTNTENITQEQLTVEDLKAILRLIDVVSARGAIKPQEMTAVGLLYEKINSNTNQDKKHEM
tara:strand:- start:1053 stop:1247 length:195 start_codon:yes stop_codon:yes gene_type:complete